VAQAERAGKALRDTGASAGVSEADLAAVDLDRSLARRRAFGGTAPVRVAAAAAEARRRIAALRARRIA
jgi:hypothetical protein